MLKRTALSGPATGAKGGHLAHLLYLQQSFFVLEVHF